MKGSGKSEVIIMRFLGGQWWNSEGIRLVCTFLFLIIIYLYKFMNIN